MYDSHHGPGGREPLTLTAEVRHGGSGKDRWDVTTGSGTFLEIQFSDAEALYFGPN
ncbi:hypothetical protein Anapl_10132 [Anas platyrhynchos]|uniref:Uncharacterized protein n=1 Tax=Anas platyrhynchos TaxID=8839 RepID=R0LR35_ANAPL|nr:hypothetical protein Anapl_10132 [Anas platyrhynchos]